MLSPGNDLHCIYNVIDNNLCNIYMVSGIISNLEMIDWLMFWAMLAMHVGFSRVAAHRLLFVRIRLQRRRPQFDSWVGKIRWRRDRLPIPVFLGFPGGSNGKESACKGGDPGSIPGLGRSPGKGNGNSLQYSCLENPSGQRKLAGYCPWARKELDMTEHSTGLLDQRAILVFVFWEPFILLSIMAVQICIPTPRIGEFLFHRASRRFCHL